MEHVGRHFERGEAEEAKKGEAEGERFVDEELRMWLLREGLLEVCGKGWRLVDERCVVVLGGERAGSVDGSEVDAEAEDE